MRISGPYKRSDKSSRLVDCFVSGHVKKEINKEKEKPNITYYYCSSKKLGAIYVTYEIVLHVRFSV